MTVKQFECESAERLNALLVRDPNAPYRAHRELIGGDRYDNWAANRGAGLLCNATGAFEAESGAIAWRTLPWDTAQFGFPAGRVDLLITAGSYGETRSAASHLLQHALDHATAHGIRHLVARIDSTQVGHAHALAEDGFELIDGIQTFALALDAEALGAPPGTRPAETADGERIAGIARTSFRFDRFHNDVAIGAEKADQLHESWARNSVSGVAADAVLLAVSGDSIDGFVTVKLDSSSNDALAVRIASIPLVAIAAEARGKGAARRATDAALAWCSCRNVQIVEVGTQISNVPAARLYQAAGFRTTGISLTYRRIIG